NPNSLGIGIGVVATVGIIAVVGFFPYKKNHNHEGFRNSVATPGTQYI
ncbi:9016_t:CDS:1, partial [Gigaspora rosea]